MFLFDENMTISDDIIQFGNKKFNNPIGYVLLSECLSYVSLFNLNHIPPLSILIIAPKGQFKSQCSEVFMSIFKKGVMNLGSDFTMNSMLLPEIKTNLNYKTLVSGDLTLLLSSKRPQSKNRLCSGLAELLSDGRYRYSDFKSTELIEARISFVANITHDSFIQNRNKMFVDNTFIDRLFPFFYEISNEDIKLSKRDFEKKVSMKFKKKIQIKPTKIKITNEDHNRIEKLTDLLCHYGVLSYNRANDKIKAILVSNAILNNQNNLKESDFEICKKLIEFSRDPLCVKIMELIDKGVYYKKIWKELNISESTYYNYRPIAVSWLSVQNEGLEYEKIES